MRSKKAVRLASELLFPILVFRTFKLKVLPMKVFLQTSWPLDDNREIVVKRFPFVIGRRSDSDHSLPLAFVSRRHCQFTRAGDQVLVQDLESHNGTFVNGQRASSPLPVQNGDELTLGPCPFRVSMLHDTGEMPALESARPVVEQPATRPSHAPVESTVGTQRCLFPRLRPDSPQN